MGSQGGRAWTPGSGGPPASSASLPGSWRHGLALHLLLFNDIDQGPVCQADKEMDLWGWGTEPCAPPGTNWTRWETEHRPARVSGVRGSEPWRRERPEGDGGLVV